MSHLIPRISRRCFTRGLSPVNGFSSCFHHTKATDFLQTSDPDLTDCQRTVREDISKICSRFPDSYWQHLDESKSFPYELHSALANDGWLGICMPFEYGGCGLGISEAAIMMQTIAESGAGMTEPVVKFGTQTQKMRWLVPLITGDEKACFGVTEPNTGLDTLKLQSSAKKEGNFYILKARTTPLKEVKKPSYGLSLFYTDLDRTQVDIKEISKMGRNAVDTNTLLFDGWKVPAEDLIGEENNGFKMIMHGMNAERILIGAEAIGLGFAALRRASICVKERIVFGRSIGQNQGIQADSWMHLEAARLLIYQAAKLYDKGYNSGEYANAAKYVAAEAAFTACERAVMTHGGMGYAKDCHVECYLREVFIPRIAPVSKELVLNYIGERVLGLPRSY